MKRLFNAIDPSPFRDRDLDPKAEEFIVGWAKDIPADAQLALLVHLDRPAGLPQEGIELREAIHEYFRQQAAGVRRRLRPGDDHPTYADALLRIVLVVQVLICILHHRTEDPHR